jgi:hypothetical protein
MKWSDLRTRLINSSPQTVLNRYLTAAGVSLAPGMKPD